MPKPLRKRTTEFRLESPFTQIRVGDCRNILKRIPPESVDCIFADQPYNIGVDYDNWDDNLSQEDFWEFTFEWITLCADTLKTTGSFFLWLPPYLANRVATFLDDLGLYQINDICVVQRFGQHQTGKFISGHVRLLYFSKSLTDRTWNPDSILVPSLRASKYNDKRTQETSTPGKRVPFDVWGIDEPHFGRVTGSHSNKERSPLHPNQVPEAVLFRCLLATTNVGDLVLDPFCGSGTTGTVARYLERESIGIEISEKYARSAFERIQKGPVRGINK